MLKRLFGLLGWLGVALVFGAFAMRLLKPGWQQWYTPLAMAGLACTLLYILSQWREIARAFSGRQARYGTLSLASIVVVIAILAAINYLGSRHSKRWDLTAAKQYSLADQTKKVLQSLDQPIRVIVFARTEDFARFRQRLDEYQHQSEQLKVEYVDPERQPLVAQAYMPLVESGTVVFERGKQVERANSDSEQTLTNALVKVVQGTQTKVYFVQGHEERGIDSQDRGGYGTVVQYLTSENFAHETLVLSQVRAIPDDASVLVVAGPKVDFFPNEIDLLKGYLAKGGKVLFLLDPPDRPDAPPLANLSALLNEWAIEIGNDVVINMPADYRVKEGEAIEIRALGALPNTDGTYVLAAKYMAHPLMEGISRSPTVFRVVRTVTAKTEGAGGRVAQALIESTPTSWAETDLKRLFGSAQVAREPAKGDKDGPLTLAAAASATASAPPADASKPDAANADAPRRETRLVVIGDSDFASNQILGFGRNVDLFMNAINWLAQREEMIAIRPRDPEDRRITMTAAQQQWIMALTVLIIPGIILAGGVLTWWRRR